MAERISVVLILNYGKTFGLTSPVVLDLNVLVLTFGFTVRFNLAGIIGIIIAFLYTEDCNGRGDNIMGNNFSFKLIKKKNLLTMLNVPFQCNGKRR